MSIKSLLEKKRKNTKKYLTIGMLLNFGLLGVTKYTNFIIGNINSIITSIGTNGTLSFIDIAMPMGIFFYTFKTMSYLLDVYRERHGAERNLFKLGLFVSFFPQLVQGPISRYKDLSQSLFEGHEYNYLTVRYGLQRIVWFF